MRMQGFKTRVSSVNIVIGFRGLSTEDSWFYSQQRQKIFLSKSFFPAGYSVQRL